MSPDFEANLASMLNDMPMSEVSAGFNKFKEGLHCQISWRPATSTTQARPKVASSSAACLAHLPSYLQQSACAHIKVYFEAPCKLMHPPSVCHPPFLSYNVTISCCLGLQSVLYVFLCNAAASALAKSITIYCFFVRPWIC